VDTIELLYEYIRRNPHRSGVEIALAHPRIPKFRVATLLRQLYELGRAGREECTHDGQTYFIYKVREVEHGA
jgi:hypothetical protein